MENNVENKSNKGIIIALSIVIVVLIGTIAFMFMNNNSTKNLNDNKTEENKQEEEQEKENEQDAEKESEDNEKQEENDIEKEEDKNVFKPLSLTDPLVEKLYGYVTVEPDFNEVVDLFSKYGTMTNKDIPDELKVKMALTIGKMGDKFEFLETNEGLWGPEKTYVLDGDVVLNKINEILGKGNGYKHISTSTNFPSLAMANPVCAVLEYDSQSNQYKMIEKQGCGGATAHFVKTKLVSAEKNNDTVILTQKIYMISGGVTYKTLDAKDVIDANCGQNCNKDEYFENGATTTYTFKLDSDGNYYFDNKLTK